MSNSSNWPNNFVATARSAHNAYRAVHGDPSAQLAFLNDVRKLSMPRPKKSGGVARRQFKRRYRKMKRSNGYLKAVRIPVRLTIPWTRTKGTTGKWSFEIKLQELVKNFVHTYDEFKMQRLTVRWLPNNSTSSMGLTAAVLMDQSGFGDFGAASAAAWFTTISTMPGSYVGNRHTSFALRWKPTEPAAREWRSYQRSEGGYTICRFYMADNGAEDSELGGVILVSGFGYGRGMYYNAATMATRIALNARSFDDRLDEATRGFEMI